MPENFARVEENIYRGGAPSIRDLEMLNSIYHIKRVISLDSTTANQIAPTLKQMKIEHLIIPINSSATTVTDPINNLIRNISTLLTAKQPVYIHCLHGQDRTGFAIALFRILHDGWNVDNALNEARKFGYGQGISLVTQKLFKQILSGLKGKTDISSADDDDNSSISGFSFAPNLQQYYLAKDPTEELDHNRQVRIELYNKLPIVGEHNNNGPIQGAGPVENSGGLQYE